MTIQVLIPIYLHFCDIQKQLDIKTRKAYQTDLKQLAAILPEQQIEHVTLEMLENGMSQWHGRFLPKTVKRKMASVRAFFRWAEEKEYITENPCRNLKTRFRESKTLPGQSKNFIWNRCSRLCMTIILLHRQ